MGGCKWLLASKHHLLLLLHALVLLMGVSGNMSPMPSGGSSTLLDKITHGAATEPWVSVSGPHLKGAGFGRLA